MTEKKVKAESILEEISIFTNEKKIPADEKLKIAIRSLSCNI